MFWGKKSDFFEGGGKMKKKNQKSNFVLPLHLLIYYILYNIYIYYIVLLNAKVEQNEKVEIRGKA